MNKRELAELSILHGALQKQEELEMLAEFLKDKLCESVLEIGTGHGGTLWFWHHLKGNKLVLTVDMPGGPFGGGPTEEDKEKIRNWADEEQITILCSGDSHTEEIRAEVSQTLIAEGFPLVDILMIDGDHTYEGVKKDYEMYSPFCKDGGLIIFHDICEHAPELNCHVKEFWEEIRGNDYKEFVCEPKNWGGIAVLEK